MPNIAPRRRIAIPTPPPPAPTRTARGSATTSTSVKVKGTEYPARQTSRATDPVDVGDMPYGKIGVSVGQTVNLGDFQSLRIDIHVEMPCVSGQEKETYEDVSSMVSELYAEEEARWLAGNK